jgi:hypothetical protein
MKVSNLNPISQAAQLPVPVALPQTHVRNIALMPIRMIHVVLQGIVLPRFTQERRQPDLLRTEPGQR